jgi:hypothetical protein
MNEPLAGARSHEGKQVEPVKFMVDLIFILRRAMPVDARKN